MTNKVLASLALMAAIGTTAARADFKDFGMRCSPGAIRTCVSMSITTTAFGSGTQVHLRVRNWAGSYVGDMTGGSLISRIGLVAPNVVGAGALHVTAGGGAAVFGPAGPQWFLRAPGGLGNMIELTAGITTHTTGGGIMGCNTPFGGVPKVRFETCAPNAYVDFAFSTSNRWSASNAEVAWLVVDANNPTNSSIECDSNTGTVRSYCAGVAPEPVTMLLLGSGLASMGGFGIIRRRRGKDVVNG